MNDPLRALILGILQGLTEFIPVSSSAHLVIVPWLFGWGGSGLAFNVALQLGTLLAVLVYFRKDLLELVAGSVRALLARREADRPHLRLAIALAVGSVPAALIGFLFEEPIERLFHAGEISTTSLLVIAGGLAIMGLALLGAEHWGTKSRLAASLTMWQVFFIGFAQALALVPGVSRSGSTITAGLLLGLRRPEAARFSFLLAVPITFGAGLLEAVQIAGQGLPRAEWSSFGVGVFSAAVVGYASIWFLLSYLQTHSNRPFAVYRLGLASLIVALVFFR